MYRTPRRHRNEKHWWGLGARDGTPSRRAWDSVELKRAQTWPHLQAQACASPPNPVSAFPNVSQGLWASAGSFLALTSLPESLFIPHLIIPWSFFSYPPRPPFTLHCLSPERVPGPGLGPQPSCPAMAPPRAHSMASSVASSGIHFTATVRVSPMSMMPSMIHVIRTAVAVAQLVAHSVSKAMCSSVGQLISQAVEHPRAQPWVQVQTKADAGALKVICATIYQGGGKVSLKEKK